MSINLVTLCIGLSLGKTLVSSAEYSKFESALIIQVTGGCSGGSGSAFEQRILKRWDVDLEELRTQVEFATQRRSLLF